MTGVRRRMFVACASSTVWLMGCAASQTPPGVSTATWQLAPLESVSSESRELNVAVTRLGCASGKTGSVLTPQLEYELDRILIRTDVVALDGAYDCQGNDTVSLTIALDEPVGERQLVDAACLETEASDTSACSDDGVRWPAASS